MDESERPKARIVLPEGRTAILLAAFNGAAYLEEQLESLEHQSRRDFTCFIHDDNSTDETPQIAADWCAAHPEHFVYLGSERIGGAKRHFLYLLQQVEADEVMLCDQDDVWFPQKLEKTLHAMRKAESSAKKGAVCVFSDATVTDEQLKVRNESFWDYSGIRPERLELEDLLYQNPAPGCTMMINRPLRNFFMRGMELHPEIPEQIRMHDWYLMLLAAACGRLVRIPEPLMYYRQHGANTVGAGARRSLPQQILRLFQWKAWIQEKRDYFAVRKGNALALESALTCLIAGDDASGSDLGVNSSQICRSLQTVRRFLHRQEAPLVIRLGRLYRWKLYGCRRQS